jgi:multiple sugar transport system ATP-binding protein
MTLYHRPASLFVAEFIGSPKMNVLPGFLLASAPSSAQVQVAGQTLSATVDAQRIAQGGTLSLGCRPEDMRLVAPGTPNSLPGQVSHIEKLGEASLLYVELGQGLPVITVRVDGTAREQVGQAIQLELPVDLIHLFDADGMACERMLDLPV